jgi:hypothetical protein
MKKVAGKCQCPFSFYYGFYRQSCSRCGNIANDVQPPSDGCNDKEVKVGSYTNAARWWVASGRFKLSCCWLDVGLAAEGWRWGSLTPVPKPSLIPSLATAGLCLQICRPKLPGRYSWQWILGGSQDNGRSGQVPSYQNISFLFSAV